MHRTCLDRQESTPRSEIPSLYDKYSLRPGFQGWNSRNWSFVRGILHSHPSSRDRNDPSPSLPIRGGQLFPLPSTLQRRCVRALLDRFPTLKLEHSAGKSANKCYGRNGLLVLHGWGGVKLRRTCLAVRKFTDKFQVIANTVTRLWNIYQLTDSGILFSSSM